MSLIVARKEGMKLAIVSDTKLTYENHEIKGLKTVPTEGIIKTIIINPNLCISFANVVSHAEEALKEIENTCTFDQAIQILTSHFQTSNKETEFIVCSGRPEPKIYEIKTSNVGEVQSSWIGDFKAFNMFQESMQGIKKPKQLLHQDVQSNNNAAFIMSMDMTAETNMQVELFSKMSSAIDDVIEAGNIDSVGGFKVNVVFEEQFEYTKYVKMFTGNEEIYEVGSHISGHGKAGDGAYSVNFLGSSADFKTVGLHVKQGHFGIIYNRQENGLLHPKLFDLDEVDFIDCIKEHCNIVAGIATEDRANKFITDAKKASDKEDHFNAIRLLEKALDSVEGNKKAEILFYKGICFLNINQEQAASRDFIEAVKIDPSFQEKILQVLKQKK